MNVGIFYSAGSLFRQIIGSNEGTIEPKLSGSDGMQKMTVMTLPEELAAMVSPPQTKPRADINHCKAGILEGVRTVFYFHDRFLLWLLALLLGRLTILGDLSPFGLAFFAAVMQSAKPKAWQAALWTSIGVLTTGNFTQLGLYLFVIVMVVQCRARLTRLEKKVFAIPVFMFLFTLLGGVILQYTMDGVLYGYLTALFNAVLCMVASYLFQYGTPLLFSKEDAARAYEKPASEAMVGLIVIFALGIAGIGEMEFAGLGVRMIACNVMVIVLAFAGGAGLGASVGVVVGAVCGLSDGNAVSSIALYAVSGTLAGVFRSLGKFAVILGFLLGNLFMHLGFTQVPLLMQSLTESFLAAALLLFVPIGKALALQKNLAPVFESPMPDFRILDENHEKLGRIASMFYELGGMFGQVKEEEPQTVQQDGITALLGIVGQEVCESCTKRPECWEGQYYRTYQAMLDLFASLDADPKVKSIEIPEFFQMECAQGEKVFLVTRQALEKRKIHGYWKTQLLQQRQMVSEQMRAAGNIIAGLAEELNKVPPDYGRMEQSIRSKAAQIGCSIGKMRFSGKRKVRGIEIEKNCCGKIGECRTSLLPIIAASVRESFYMENRCGSAAVKCRIRLHPIDRYDVRTAAVSAPKNYQEVCGDSHVITPLNDGKVGILLSDGMGSGSIAAGESKMTLHCLKNLLKSGFDLSVAAKTVNSLLLLHTTGELFATIDLAVIDQSSGDVDFLKVSAVPSYIKRVREVIPVQSAALPVGILNQIEIKPIQMKLSSNDYLIMVSDGIDDTKHKKARPEDKDGWLLNFLRRFEETDVKTFADAILKEALKMSGGKAKDDMTVVVAKLIKNQ